MTEIEKALFNRISELAADYEDGETGTVKCFEMACGSLGFFGPVVDWAVKIAMTESALEAGIPLSVIEGKTKLTDHFSREYIDSQKSNK